MLQGIYRDYLVDYKRPPANVFSNFLMKAASKAISENNLDALKASLQKIENKNQVCFIFMEFIFHL